MRLTGQLDDDPSTPHPANCVIVICWGVLFSLLCPRVFFVLFLLCCCCVVVALSLLPEEQYVFQCASSDWDLHVDETTPYVQFLVIGGF